MPRPRTNHSLLIALIAHVHSQNYLDSYNINPCSFPELVRHGNPLLPLGLVDTSALDNHPCVRSSCASFGQCARIDDQYRLDHLVLCQYLPLPRVTGLRTLTVP